MAYREPAFSLVRYVWISLGASVLVWGSLELRLDPRRLIRQWIQVVIVVAVLGILFAPGYPGIGRLQSAVLVIVLAVAVPVFLLRNVAAGWLAEPFRSRYALPAVIGASVILGAWAYVLASVNPMECEGYVRCADELRSALLLAIPVVAAGLYVVYVRWAVTEGSILADESVIRLRRLFAVGIAVAVVVAWVIWQEQVETPNYDCLSTLGGPRDCHPNGSVTVTWRRMSPLGPILGLLAAGLIWSWPSWVPRRNRDRSQPELEVKR